MGASKSKPTNPNTVTVSGRFCFCGFVTKELLRQSSVNGTVTAETVGGSGGLS